MTGETLINSICFHCGDECFNEIHYDEKVFCCKGCRAVYELIFQNDLCSYYTFQEHPGLNIKGTGHSIKFDYLDDVNIQKKIIEFADTNITKVTFYIPSIHCSSCIYLLEHLYKINSGVISSKTDFTQKRVSIFYRTKETGLKEIVTDLYKIGYEPEINAKELNKNEKPDILRKLYYKIGIAGFCFGNIMLFSFPEYLSLGNLEMQYRTLFGYLNILLVLPVFFYCASGYFISAYAGIKQKHINLDFPISLGISVIFLRSVYEVLSGTGSGYFDSLTGLIFFLLIGKLVQTKTFDFLNFERDYRSYFPLSVVILKNSKETTIPVSNLKKGDRILIRNGELIPADSILFKGNANVDYSFVTGESSLTAKVLGEIIYAGGRQSGGVIELEVIREISQSYLTQLWNNDTFQKPEKFKARLNDTIAKYFTAVTLAVALISGLLWMKTDIKTAMNVFTSVLIVACPCALALAGPFALANTIRIFGRNKFYLKNTSVIEKLSEINSVVFDKTGTLTQLNRSELNYFGSLLTNTELIEIKSLLRNSTHPFSRKIYDTVITDVEIPVTDFKEFPGEGIRGTIGVNHYKIGSFNFVFNFDKNIDHGIKASKVYVVKNDCLLGNFLITNYFRDGLKDLISAFCAQKKNISVLTGDNNNEEEYLKLIFGSKTKMKFFQKPLEKLQYVRYLQSENNNVMMIGDGLNDAGALKQSDVGIAVTENISCFSPSCDAILDAENFSELNKYLKFSKTTMNIIKASFVFSMLYNLIGFAYAVQGLLSPIVAAILMPVSSISVVLFAVTLTNYFAKRRKLI